jgi:hypothetical protein
MTEQRNQLADLFAACWKDEAVKQRFMADPKAVLAEYGMDVPDEMDVKVVENAGNCVHITMPAAPGRHSDLSDAELSKAAGGGAAADAFTPFSNVPEANRPYLQG